MSGTHVKRPATSKPRGQCKYYDTPRGCFAGANCKFLHGQDLTPYDSSKSCRFYAAGFCKRGAQCWFSHTLKGKEKEVIADEDDLCSICFEKPVTYGLLNDCSHIFCITCIKQWRDPANKSDAGSGNTKLCPMCRQPSKFIIPSSKFHPHGEAKDNLLAQYMESMARVSCKYFQRSLVATPSRPFCPFGKDCFYQHRNLDGSEYTFHQGVDASMRRYATRRDTDPLFAYRIRVDVLRSLGDNFPQGFDPDSDEDELVHEMNQLFATLTDQTVAFDSDGESNSDDGGEMPPLERISNINNQERPLPMMFDSESDDGMPALASVSNPSDSESDEDEGSSSEDHEAVDERLAPVRPFDLEFDPDMQLLQTRNAFASMWRTPPVHVETPPAEPNTAPMHSAFSSIDVEERSDANADNVVERNEPPFLTDGRGRVVWSSASGSSTRRASSTFRGASSAPGSPGHEKSPSPPVAGFTTDGRGRVVGTTDASDGEDSEKENEVEELEAPIPTRSLLGRMFDAFF